MIYEEGFSKFKERVQTSGMNALRRLPYIGEVTQKHLARNVGILDVSKYDIWLKRLAEKLKFADVPQLTSYLADESGEREGVVDIILWRFCADNGWKEYGLDSLDDFVASL